MASPSVHQAVREIAARCDGAQTEDGVGFSGQDTKFGKRLAVIPDSDWTPAMVSEAHRMLAKYRGQLAKYGIDYDAIPVPAPVGRDEQRDSRRIAYFLARDVETSRKMKDPDAVRVEVENGVAFIYFPYDAGVVAAVRRVPEARWNQRSWETPNVAEAKRFVAAVLDGTYADYAPEPDPDAGPAAPERFVEQTENGWLVTYPYDPALVSAMRAIGGAKWRPSEKKWFVPTTSAEALADFAAEHDFETDGTLKAVIDAAAAQRATSSATDADFDVPGLGGELLPFQRAGVAYASRAKRAIIGDQVGLGKTVQALATIKATDAFPAVIVTPALIKQNWEREVHKWLGEDTSVSILAGRKAADIDPADIYIINYDILDAWASALNSMEPKAVVFDECQYLKNAKSRRTKAAMLLARGVEKKNRASSKVGHEAEVILGLSGTPVMNRPAEWVSLLDILGRLDAFGGGWAFLKRYCDPVYNGYGWDFKGASNTSELVDRLRSTCYVRRTKAAVMPELPPVRRDDIELDLTKEQRAEYGRYAADFLTFIRESAERIAQELGEDATVAAREAAERAQRAEVLSRINTLRQVAARIKTPNVVEWVRERLESDPEDKVLVFAHHREVQAGLFDALTEFSPADIRADNDDRDGEVQRFQKDDGCRVAVCSLLGSGFGVTLTEGKSVVVVERPWRPADVEQAEGRAYGRVNDPHGVNTYFLDAPGTIDEDMAALLAKKEAVVTASTDGETDAQATDGDVDFILDRLRG